jgi:hypothetical protein
MSRETGTVWISGQFEILGGLGPVLLWVHAPRYVLRKARRHLFGICAKHALAIGDQVCAMLVQGTKPDYKDFDPLNRLRLS